MKNWLPFFILLVCLCGLVQSQYDRNWINTDLINPGNDVTRCAVYNRATDHVLVPSRMTGTDIFILDAASGDSIGKMDTGMISGGTYPPTPSFIFPA